MSPIKHVFVLMLENRSFDHFFGLAGIEGIEPPPASTGFRPGATDRTAGDPPHEFAHVAAQIDRGAMDGFEPVGKLGFGVGAVPVVEALAENYLLFDNWFASMPGPTWPNRFFVHAASSGGLTDSPGGLDAALAIETSWKSFSFQNGSLYDRLDGAGLTWRVYHGDATPQVLAVHGMTSKIFDGDRFRSTYPGDHTVGDFASDVALGAGYGIDYTFIEPRYGLDVTGNFFGDSQHPTDSVAAGEGLVKYVYESLRNSDLWASSALLLVWDEHGGFYDRVPPPACEPPGDTPLNFSRGTHSGSPPPFAFDSLGVRVPAILVSPFAPRGLASRRGGAGPFDHASIVRSVRELFGLAAPLTARDASSPSWLPLLLTTLRSDADCPKLLPTPSAAIAPMTAAIANASPAQPAPDSFVAGLTLIASDLDHLVAHRTGQAPLALAPEHALAFRRATPASGLSPAMAGASTASASALGQYVVAVGERVRQHQRDLIAAARR